jgi:F-type H+-transporting ATPase subunit gamma
LIDEWTRNQSIGKIVVIFSEHTSRASYEVKCQQLLPIDLEWLKSIQEQGWPTNQSPAFTMEPNQLFSSLIRQYFFVSLFRAAAESLASENASRLAAMQGAERNIGNRIDGLTQLFHQTRQMSITGELLDIASGFEAIMSTDTN